MKTKQPKRLDVKLVSLIKNSEQLADDDSDNEVNQFIEFKSLVEEGADVNQIDGKGRSLLHLAAKYNRFDIVNYLVEKGAYVNLEDSKKRTPNYWLSFNENKNLEKTLFDDKEYDITEIVMTHAKILDAEEKLKSSAAIFYHYENNENGKTTTRSLNKDG
ncbi:ankyrin repeat domain-containing protein [Thiotrichales bacterium 19S3-7]|nr:ankyrin repeat domain-containing protein [Thiotrichales bacterium 19S3-7]MCF6801406.1 ankyrin repeat domain-containing protein [Thiotrichales bacterium 19S3-11]